MNTQKRITVYINDQPVESWYGATVQHAVITYDQQILKDIRELRAWIVDGRESRIDLGGSLQDGVRLYIRYDQEHSEDLNNKNKCWLCRIFSRTAD